MINECFIRPYAMEEPSLRWREDRRAILLTVAGSCASLGHNSHLKMHHCHHPKMRGFLFRKHNDGMMGPWQLPLNACFPL